MGGGQWTGRAEGNEGGSGEGREERGMGRAGRAGRELVGRDGSPPPLSPSPLLLVLPPTSSPGAGSQRRGARGEGRGRCDGPWQTSNFPRAFELPAPRSVAGRALRPTPLRQGGRPSYARGAAPPTPGARWRSQPPWRRAQGDDPVAPFESHVSPGNLRDDDDDDDDRADDDHDDDDHDDTTTTTTTTTGDLQPSARKRAMVSARQRA